MLLLSRPRGSRRRSLRSRQTAYMPPLPVPPLLNRSSWRRCLCHRRRPGRLLCCCCPIRYRAGWDSGHRPKHLTLSLAVSCLSKLFGISEGSRLVHLPPAVRQELCVVALLAPMLASNVAAPFLSEVFASDASMKRGAYVRAAASQVLPSARGRRKGLLHHVGLPGSSRSLPPVPLLCPDLLMTLPISLHGLIISKLNGAALPLSIVLKPLESSWSSPGPASIAQALTLHGFCVGPAFDRSTSSSTSYPSMPMTGCFSCCRLGG